MYVYMKGAYMQVCIRTYVCKYRSGSQNILLCLLHATTTIAKLTDLLLFFFSPVQKSRRKDSGPRYEASEIREENKSLEYGLVWVFWKRINFRGQAVQASLQG
ncbi:hypothetical protein TWF173_011375 [Orbilia oligospora]|nr:hypothetical protein TWF173_011375 [Orbilia oligospora]